MNGLSDYYLKAGLTAACNTISQEKYTYDVKWLDAHFGLAVMAGYWLTHELDLDSETCKGIQKNCDAVIENFSKLFEPIDFDSGITDPTGIDQLAKTLEPGIHRYVRSGHNVIYATYMIKTLREKPKWSKPLIIEKLLELLMVVNGNNQLERIDAPIPSESDLPKYLNIENIVETVFKDFVAINYTSFEQHKVAIGHVLTHCHALSELTNMNFNSLALKGFDAHRAHLFSTRNVNQDKMMKKKIHSHHPLTAAFWNSDIKTDRHWEVGHTFKYLYSFHRIKNLVQNKALREAAEKQLLYII